MDFDRLAEFITVVEAKSFTQAAQQLKVNPATLSSRQKSFERSLGFTLFTYEHSQLQLTTAGENFYHNGLKINQTYQALKSNMLATTRDRLTQLRIGVVGSEIPNVLQAFFAGLQTRYPHTAFKFLDDQAYSIRTGLLTHQVDLFLAPVTATFKAQGLQRFPLMKLQPQVLLPADHGLTQGATVDLNQLAGATFLSYPTTKETCIQDFQKQILDKTIINYTLNTGQNSVRFYKNLVMMQKQILIYPGHFTYLPLGCVARPLITTEQPVYTLFMAAEKITPEIMHFKDDLITFVNRESGQNDGY
ncbi:LysR family transcriptional regulator [Agrilactobacillus yilanensis]|uniref:LysR family transcriptional regulator n=1 Tax=Agrilactobacillus yilanensis TaxID=2485997 RepID=A0ABW4J763_9LACO|nr:LysR family transcriptional regulator [Agrilactobacillus yilanensis]